MMIIKGGTRMDYASNIFEKFSFLWTVLTMKDFISRSLSLTSKFVCVIAGSLIFINAHGHESNATHIVQDGMCVEVDTSHNSDDLDLNGILNMVDVPEADDDTGSDDSIDAENDGIPDYTVPDLNTGSDGTTEADDSVDTGGTDTGGTDTGGTDTGGTDTGGTETGGTDTGGTETGGTDTGGTDTGGTDTGGTDTGGTDTGGTDTGGTDTGGTDTGGTDTGGTTSSTGWMFESFDGAGPLEGFVTNNDYAVPGIVQKDGRYFAPLTNNKDDITLHFHSKQGRLDAKRLSFPFEFIVRNIGIGTFNDTQIAPNPNDFSSPSRVFMFAGIQVHVLDLDDYNSAHFVVGHRGSTSYTVEGKNTRNGRSRVNDAGQGVVPNGRADLRVVGRADGSLIWYWQQPNENLGVQADDWIAYRGNGDFPGKQATFGAEVYVGLITYAFEEASVPFVGTADSIEWIEGDSQF